MCGIAKPWWRHLQRQCSRVLWSARSHPPSSGKGRSLVVLHKGLNNRGLGPCAVAAVLHPLTPGEPDLREQLAGCQCSRAGGACRCCAAVAVCPTFQAPISEKGLESCLPKQWLLSCCRFGSFEICKPPDNQTGRAGPSAGMSGQLLLPLVGYVIKHHHPDVWSYYGGGDDISMKGMSGTQVGGGHATCCLWVV